MSGPPPSRPWFRLATMMRPPPPPPAATPTPPPNPSPAPPRPPIIRPTFTTTTPPPQPTPTPSPPQQPTPTPTPPSPQQPNPTRSPPRPIPSVVRATDVVEPQPPAPPSPPPSFSPPSSPPPRKSPPSSPPTSPPRSTPSEVVNRSPSPPLTTTRALTPPSSPPKFLKPLEQTPPPPQPINPIAPPPSPPPRSPSPPKRPHLILSPPPSPPRPTPIQQIEHPLPPSSPPKLTTFSEQNSTTSSNTRPLSPLLLPSLKQKPYDEPAPEYQQKTMHVDQETKEKPKHSASSVNARSHIGGFHPHNPTRKPETLKKHWESEDASGKNIITIAGENKGAIMNITPSSDKKHEYGNNFNRLKPTTSNDEETESEANNKNKNQDSNSSLKTSYLNSNVQGVNNSLLFNCSISHHDPGIHLTLSMNSDRDTEVHSKEHNKRALI